MAGSSPPRYLRQRRSHLHVASARSNGGDRACRAAESLRRVGRTRHRSVGIGTRASSCRRVLCSRSSVARLKAGQPHRNQQGPAYMTKDCVRVRHKCDMRRAFWLRLIYEA
eukprot:1225979-Prymnesium_polylepis.1